MYVKLFDKLMTSSVWEEPPSTRIIWITILLLMDIDGFTGFSGAKGLARIACVEPKEAEKALEYLSSPDGSSRNPDHDGRRIELMPGGCVVLNAHVYRKLQNTLSQRELNRLYQERHRSKKSKENLTSPDKSLQLTSTSTSTSVLRGKKSVRRKGKKETVFSESPVGEWEVFRAALVDWDEAQARFYFDKFQTKEALTPSKYLYADWIRAAREWDKRDPDEWKKSGDPKKGGRTISEIMRGKK